jgi:hypothetical protein
LSKRKRRPSQKSGNRIGVMRVDPGRSLRDQTKRPQGRTTMKEIGREEGVTTEGIGIMIGATRDMRGLAPKTGEMRTTRRRGIAETATSRMAAGRRGVQEMIPKSVTKRPMTRTVRRMTRTSKRLKKSKRTVETKNIAKIKLPQSLKIEMISFKHQIRRLGKILDKCLIRSKKLSPRLPLRPNKSKMFQKQEDKMISRSLRLIKDTHQDVIMGTTAVKKIEVETAVATVPLKTTSR